MSGASAHTETQDGGDAQGTPPFVVHVDGEVAANGEAIALRIVRTDEMPVTICLRTEDVQYLVSILLALNGEARRLQPQRASQPPRGAIPLPLEAINVGQNDDDETFLMLETGGAALMFRVPDESLREIGQTLLTIGAVDSRPS
jgi:hypothetical protein